MIVLFTALLLAAGCTQPTGTGTSTVTPTPTTTASPVTVNVTSNVTTTVPTSVTTNVTTNVTVTAITNVTLDVTALKAELPVLGKKFADQLDGKALATAAVEGPNSTAFVTVLNQLKAFKASDSRLIYVYTLEQQNGTVRFVVDADYGLPGGSDFLEEYPDAPAELKGPVTAPLGVGPYTDSYGTFVSGYAPVNTTTNESVFILGIDVEA